MTEHIILYEGPGNLPPSDDFGDELWWIGHYVCTCGWESHDSHTDMPDDGRSLAEVHAKETSGRISS